LGPGRIFEPFILVVGVGAAVLEVRPALVMVAAVLTPALVLGSTRGCSGEFELSRRGGARGGAFVVNIFAL
jgi:hypothetical protein